MNNFFKHIVCGLSVVIIIFLLSCNSRRSVAGIVVGPQTFECGKTDLSDLVHAQFRLRNISTDTVKLLLMPECDCITLNTERLILAPHDRFTLVASAEVNIAGEYVKQIFVQPEDSEFILTLSIHGNAISKE